MLNNIYYCEECRKKKDLPVGKIDFATVGPCEFCRTFGSCHEVDKDKIAKLKAEQKKVLEGFEKWMDEHRRELEINDDDDLELYRSAYEAGCADGYHDGYWNS